MNIKGWPERKDVSKTHDVYEQGKAVGANAMLDECAKAVEGMKPTDNQIFRDIVASLRSYWSFDKNQQHTHTWHSREDFIEWLMDYFKSVEATTGGKVSLIERIKAGKRPRPGD